MASFATFLGITVISCALAYGVMRLAMSSKGFKARPVEEQAQVRKTYKLALIASPPIMIGSYFLQGASPSVLKWIPIALYICLWLIALFVLWLAFSLAVQKEIGFAGRRFAKKWRNPHAMLRSMAWLHLCFAIGLIALLVAIPMLKLGFSSWPVLITMLSACYTIALKHIERSGNVQPQDSHNVSCESSSRL